MRRGKSWMLQMFGGLGHGSRSMSRLPLAPCGRLPIVLGGILVDPGRQVQAQILSQGDGVRLVETANAGEVALTLVVIPQVEAKPAQLPADPRHGVRPQPIRA